ncbi:MAG: DUF1850 domain-containing protein [Micromonosporaceae bacterium]|nr:DUF1850 domain-containing protein [Micromonosporaceae bacterium]
MSAAAAPASGSATSASASAAGSGGLRLEIWDAGAARIAHTRQVTSGERFTLRHVHSVTHRPVKETFSVTADGIAMEELWFDTFGANLPAGPERIGDVTTTFLVEDGGYRVLHHGRLMPTVPLLAGRPHVNHELFFADGVRLRLLDLVAPSTSVELRVAAG